MQISNQISSLSVQDKIDLIQNIWESIDTSKLSISEAQQSELNTRLTRIENNETTFSSWEAVRKKLQALKR